MLKRIFDLLLSSFSMIFFALPALIIAIIIKLTSKGPVLYWSDRVGRNNEIFSMPKFRSMRTDAPEVATDKLQNADDLITPFGSFLRRSSLDEIPQLIPIFLGKMSIVGPRPALHNQHDLIAMRKKYGVHALKPGLTGLAQINGRDALTSNDKVRLDHEYLCKQSFMLDIVIILKTVNIVFRSKSISH